MYTGGAIYDFWLGECIPRITRYHKRHKRDGLCYDCKRKALSGHARCAKHLAADAESNRKYYEAMKRKAQAASKVKCA